MLNIFKSMFPSLKTCHDQNFIATERKIYKYLIYYFNKAFLVVFRLDG